MGEEEVTGHWRRLEAVLRCESGDIERRSEVGVERLELDPSRLLEGKEHVAVIRISRRRAHPTGPRVALRNVVARDVRHRPVQPGARFRIGWVRRIGVAQKEGVIAAGVGCPGNFWLFRDLNFQ